jgi:hypothetical protein
MRYLKRTLMVRLHERDGIGMVYGIYACIALELGFVFED